MISYVTSKELINIVNILDEKNKDLQLQNRIQELRNAIQLHSYVIDYFANNNLRSSMYVNSHKNNIVYIPQQYLCKICIDENIYSKASLICGAITFGSTIYEDYFCEYHATCLFYNEANKYIYLKEVISPVPQIYIRTFLNSCTEHNKYNKLST